MVNDIINLSAKTLLKYDNLVKIDGSNIYKYIATIKNNELSKNYNVYLETEISVDNISKEKFEALILNKINGNTEDIYLSNNEVNSILSNNKNNLSDESTSSKSGGNGSPYELNNLDLFGDAQEQLNILNSSVSGGLLSCHDKIYSLADAVPGKYSYIGANAKSAVKMFESSKVTSEISNFASAIAAIYKSLNDALYGDKFLKQLVNSEYIDTMLAGLSKDERDKAIKEIKDRIKNADRTSHNDFMFEIDAILLDYNPNVSEEDKKLTIEKAKENGVKINESLQITGYTNAVIIGVGDTLKGLDGVDELPDLQKGDVWQTLYNNGILDAPEYTTFTTATGIDIKITPQNAGENYSGPVLKGQILTDTIFGIRDEYYSTKEGQDALYNACLIQSGATFDTAIGTTLYLQKCISEGKDDWIKDELKHIPGMLEEINNNFGKKREISKEEKKYVEQYKKAYNGALPYNYYKDNNGNYYTYNVSNSTAQKELEYLDFHSNEFNGNYGDNKIYTAFSDVGHVSAVERNYKGAYIETKTSVYLKEMGKTADDVKALEEARQKATNDYDVLNNGVKDSKRRKELISQGEMSFDDIVNYVNLTEGEKIDNYLNIDNAKENHDAINQNREKTEGTMFNFDLAEDATFNTVLIESLGVAGIQLTAGVGKFLESAGYDSVQMLLNSDLALRTQVEFEGETSLFDKFINYFSSKKEFSNYKDETWNNYYKSDLYNYQYNEYFNTVSEGEIKAYFDKHYADLNSNSYVGPDGKQYSSYYDIPLNVRQSVIPDLFKTSKINEWSLNDSSSSNMYLASFNEGIRNGGDFSKFYNLDSETKEIAFKQIETMEKVSVDMAGNFFKENIYDKDWYKTMEDYSIVKKDNILGVAVNQVGNMAIPILASIYAPQIIGTISPTLSTATLGTIGSTASSSLLFASAFGGASEEAINSGASFNEALSYATLSATTEILIEKLFSGIQGFGEGWADELIEWLPNKIISKVGLEDNLLTQTIKSLIAGGIGEGIEEVATDLVTPMWQSFTYMNDKNYIDIVTENVSLESLAQTFLVSFLSSMVFGTSEIVQKTNQFNKQLNSITSEIGDLPGFKEQANKILANIIGYDGSFLTTDIINDIIEKNASELLANNQNTNELQEKLLELKQKLKETQVVIEINDGITNISKELMLDVSDMSGIADKYQIVDNKIVFDNENTQTKFINTVYEMAKNNLKQELELNKNVVTNLYSNNKLNLAIQTLKNIGDKSNLSKVFGNIKLMIEENEYVIPQSVVQEITSKYTVNENNELLFTDENMSIDKFVSELHTKAIEKLKETNVSIEEQIKEIADAQKNQTTDVFNNAVAIINGFNQTSVETKDISVLEEIGLKVYSYEIVANGKTDKVNIYIDTETDTKVLENKNVKNKIQEIIESKIKNNSNIKDVYVGKIELVNGQAQVTTNREQKAFVDSKTEDIVVTEREYVDINEHKFIKQEAFVTSDNKTEKVNVYIDAETNTKLLQDKNVKDKIHEIIVETKKQNNDSKDIYIGEILVDKKSNDVIVNQKNAILLAGMNIAIQNVVNNGVYTSRTSNTRVNKQENTKEVNNKTNNTSGVFENIYAETSVLIQKYTKEMNEFIEDIRKNCQKFVLEHYKDIKNFESKYLQYKLEQRTKFNNKLNEIRKSIFSEQQKSIDSVNELIQKFKEKTDIRKKYENLREELVKKYKDELDNFISKTNEYFDKIISSIVIPINDSVINNILGTNKTNIVIDSAVSAKETLKLDLPNKLNGIETSKLLEYITNEDLLMDFANQKGTDINRINTISALKTIEKMQEYLGIKLSRNTSYMINTLYNEYLNEIVVSSMKGKLPKAYYDFDSIYKTNHNLKMTIFEMESKGYNPLDIANALLSMSNITSNYKNSRYMYNEAYKYLIDKGYSNEKAADEIGELYEKLIKQKGYETIVTKDGLKIHIQNGINWSNQPYTIDYVTKELLRLKNIYKTNVAVNVYVHDTFNSYDKYWEVKYNRKGFVSAATGGNGVINIYRNDSIEANVLSHEYAHLLDTQIMLDRRKKGRFAETKEYLEAIKLDNKAPTEYAKTNSREDFADSISLMVRKPEYFRKRFPNRYKVLSKYINIDGYKLGNQVFNQDIGNAIQTMIGIYGDNAFDIIMDYLNTGNSSLITEVNDARNIITNTSVDALIEYINNSYGNKNNETYTPFHEEFIIEDVSNQKVIIPAYFEVKGETLLSGEIENVKVETSYIESLIKDNQKLLNSLRITPANLTPQIIKDSIIKYIDFAYENNINIELSENVKKYYETYKNALNNNKVILNEMDIIINNKDGILISKNIFDKYMNGTMKEQVVFERLLDSIMSLETFEKNISNIEVLRDTYEILKDESLTKELSHHNNFKVITNVFSKLDMTKLSGPQYIYSLSNKSNETLSVYNLHDVIFNNESPIYMPTYIKHDIIYGRTKINDLIQMIEGKKEITISDAQFSIAINNLVSYLNENNIILEENLMNTLNKFTNVDSNMIVANAKEVLNGVKPYIVPKQFKVGHKFVNTVKFMEILDDKASLVGIVKGELFHQAVDGIDMGEAVTNLFNESSEIALKYKDIPNLIESVKTNFVWLNNNSYLILPKTINGIETENLFKVYNDSKELNKVINSLSLEEISQYKTAINEIIEIAKKQGFNENELETVTKLNESLNVKPAKRNVLSKLYDLFTKDEFSGGTFGTRQHVVADRLDKINLKYTYETLFNMEMSDEDFFKALGSGGITREEFNKALDKRFKKDNSILSRILNTNPDINIAYKQIKENIKLVQKNIEGLTESQAFAFLHYMESYSMDNDGICTYADIVNTILSNYIGKESKFKKDFGYPMYIKNEKGNKVLNSEMLLLDLYSIINRETLVKFKDNIAVFDENNKGYIHMHTLSSGLNQAALKDFFQFKSKQMNRNINLELTETFKFDNHKNAMHYESLLDEIGKNLEQGNVVTLSAFGFNLYARFDYEMIGNKAIPITNKLKEKATNVGGHQMTIVAIDDAGNIVVDSWGKKLIFNLKEELLRTGEERTTTNEYGITKTEVSQFIISAYKLEDSKVVSPSMAAENSVGSDAIRESSNDRIKSKQINGSDESLHSIEDNEINIPRPQIKGVKDLSIMDNIKHTLVRINDKFTGYKVNKLNTESYYDRTTKSNNKLFKQKKINKTFRDFANKHLIDIENLINNGLLKNPKISEINSLITNNRVLTSMIDDSVSIADIIGTKKPIDLDKNFNLLFDESTSEFQTRDLGLLEYSNEQILNVLSDSFKNHPLVISEVDTGKYIVEDNGYHRYSILRLHYLNEYMKVKDNPALVAELNKKYTIPVKVYKLDTIKTYSTTLLKELGINVEVKNKGLTKQSTILIDGKKVTMSDAELIEFTKEKINSDSNSVQIINRLLNESESFREFYNEYLMDELLENDINIDEMASLIVESLSRIDTNINLYNKSYTPNKEQIANTVSKYGSYTFNIFREILKDNNKLKEFIRNNNIRHITKMQGIINDLYPNSEYSSKIARLKAIINSLDGRTVLNVDEVVDNYAKPILVDGAIIEKFNLLSLNNNIGVETLYKFVLERNEIFKLLDGKAYNGIEINEISKALNELLQISKTLGYIDNIINEIESVLNILNSDLSLSAKYDSISEIHLEASTPKGYYVFENLFKKEKSTRRVIKILEEKGYKIEEIAEIILHKAIRGESNLISKAYYYRAFNYLTQNNYNEKYASTLISTMYQNILDLRGTRVIGYASGVEIRIVNNYNGKNKLLTLDNVSKMLEKASKYYSKTDLKEVNIYDSFSPRNIYCEKVQYKDFVDKHGIRATSAATATDTRIDLWEDFDNVDTIIHEYAHAIEKHITKYYAYSTLFTESNEWINAIREDKLVTNKPVTEYATSSNQEDFAEFVKEFNKNPLQIALKYPNRYKVATKYLNMEIDSKLILDYMNNITYLFDAIDNLSSILTTEGTTLEFVKQYLYGNINELNNIARIVVEELNSVYESKFEILEDFDLYEALEQIKLNEKINSKEFLKLIKEYLNGNDISSNIKDLNNLKIIEILSKEEINYWYEDKINDIVDEVELLIEEDESSNGSQTTYDSHESIVNTNTAISQFNKLANKETNYKLKEFLNKPDISMLKHIKKLLDSNELSAKTINQIKLQNVIEDIIDGNYLMNLDAYVEYSNIKPVIIPKTLVERYKKINPNNYITIENLYALINSSDIYKLVTTKTKQLESLKILLQVAKENEYTNKFIDEIEFVLNTISKQYSQDKKLEIISNKHCEFQERDGYQEFSNLYLKNKNMKETIDEFEKQGYQKRDILELLLTLSSTIDDLEGARKVYEYAYDYLQTKGETIQSAAQMIKEEYRKIISRRGTKVIATTPSGVNISVVIGCRETKALGMVDAISKKISEAEQIFGKSKLYNICIYDVSAPENLLCGVQQYKKTKNKDMIKQFRASAVATSTQIDIWNEFTNIYDVIHEYAHTIDFGVLGTDEKHFTKNGEWENAKKLDRNAVSNYGDTNLEEDFAEFVKEFYKEPKLSKEKYPNRYKVLEKHLTNNNGNTKVLLERHLIKSDIVINGVYNSLSILSSELNSNLFDILYKFIYGNVIDTNGKSNVLNILEALNNKYLNKFDILKDIDTFNFLEMVKDESGLNSEFINEIKDLNRMEKYLSKKTFSLLKLFMEVKGNNEFSEYEEIFKEYYGIENKKEDIISYASFVESDANLKAGSLFGKFTNVLKKTNDNIEIFKDALSNNNISSLSESDIDALVESIKKGKIKLKEYNLTSETIGILLDKVPINKIYPLSNVKAVKSFIEYFGLNTLVQFDKQNNDFLLGNNGENLYSLFDYYDLTIPKTEETDKLKELDNLITNAINSNKKTEYKTYTFNYSGLINTEYSKVHPELFLDESAPSDLKDAFYNGRVNSGNEYNPEWSKYLDGKSVKGVIHKSLVSYEDVKVVEKINEIGENSSKYYEGLNELASKVGMTIEEVEEILSSKLKSLIDTSEFGVRRTLKSLESILESGKIKNQFEVNHSSYGVNNTDMRMDMEENLFGIPRNMKYEDRPIYGMLLPNDLTSKYVQKGPGAYYSDGSGVIYIFDKSKIMNNTTLTLGDSLDQAGKICATNLSSPKYFGMFSEMLSTIKTKEDLLNFDFTSLYEKNVLEVGNSAYYEFQLHGEDSHTLNNLKEIVFLKMPEAKIIEKLEEMKIDWRVIDGSYSKKNSSPTIKKSESKVVKESESLDNYFSFKKSKVKPIRELSTYYGDAGKRVNSLFLKGKTTEEILDELSILERHKFQKFLDDTIEGKYLSKLSKDEIRALNMYTGEYYGEINHTLRYKSGFNSIGGINTRKLINDIDSAISKYNGLEKSMKIYRAVDVRSFTHQNSIYKDLFNGIKPYSSKEIYAVLKTLEGKEFSDLGYMSSSPAYATSFAKHLNYPIILEISAKKGTNCAYINQLSSFYNTENEILFARNTKLQIVEVLEPEDDVFGLTKVVVKCIVK